MPLLSKARLLSRPGEGAGTVKAFSYQGIETPAPGETQNSVPANAELLWEELSDPAAAQGSGKKYSEEEVQAREQQAWQNGLQEAATQGRENLEKALAAERSGLAAALCEFAKGREAYYQRLEGEVVQLVLSITRKVLHRESQVDPMLLTGVVRVALEKIAAGTTVKLRVPMNQADAWRAAFRAIPARDLTIEIVADESLTGPRCLIVTEMGATDVSLDSQLAEIERGFLDLLKQHPGDAQQGSRLHV